jgi:alginate O-acetyltransferase complex protein AlgI
VLFNSIHFLFFFLLVTTAYFILPHKYRWMLLLGASCYFYMCFVPVYILILGFTIVIDYFAGIFIERSEAKQRKMFLIASLVANIGVLAVFKYYNFFNDNLTTMMHGAGYQNPVPYLNILLPIGLSFHTFQAMSYTIEVYRGNQKAETHFGIYSLYVMFYPQLVAGPIERPQNLLHQFYEKHDFNAHNMVEGLKLMLWGFFMKLVVADRLALYVDSVYNNSAHHEGKTLALATVFFAIQIYCDFAGYSNIAIGTARTMGFKLMTNFNRPYFAKSVSEFWKRWHISLSTWFKDYLYISLGGNKVSIPRWYFNLFIVFVVSGFWHGANWTFIIWGALNGFYLVMALVTHKIRTRIDRQLESTFLFGPVKFLKIILTFFLISFSWIFFRAESIDEAMAVINKIISFRGSVYFESPSMMLYCFFAIIFLLITEFKHEKFQHLALFVSSRSPIVRQLSYASLVILILLLGVFDGGQFIYFQF